MIVSATGCTKYLSGRSVTHGNMIARRHPKLNLQWKLLGEQTLTVYTYHVFFLFLKIGTCCFVILKDSTDVWWECVTVCHLVLSERGNWCAGLKGMCWEDQKYMTLLFAFIHERKLHPCHLSPSLQHCLSLIISPSSQWYPCNFFIWIRLSVQGLPSLLFFYYYITGRS